MSVMHLPNFLYIEGASSHRFFVNNVNYHELNLAVCDCEVSRDE